MQNDEKNFSLLMPVERNTINIFGEINEKSAEMTIAQLQYLDDKFKREDIPIDERIVTLQINSPGGSVTDGIAILDTMNYVDAKIRTICLGMCASMAAVLLSAGTRGMRFATEHSEVLIHQPLGSASGQATDVVIAANRIKKVREKLNLILSENTCQSIRRIEKDTDRDTIFTAQQALKYGLIDEVIPSISKAKIQ